MAFMDDPEADVDEESGEMWSRHGPAHPVTEPPPFATPPPAVVAPPVAAHSLFAHVMGLHASPSHRVDAASPLGHRRNNSAFSVPEGGVEAANPLVVHDDDDFVFPTPSYPPSS